MMFKEKLEVFKQKAKIFFGKSSPEEMENNSKAILKKQIIKAISLGASLIVIFWLLSGAVRDAGKSLEEKNNKSEQDTSKNTIDLADKALDTEVFWRNYFEEDMSRQKTVTKEMIGELKEAQEKMMHDVKTSMVEAVGQVEQLNAKQKAQFEMTTRELKEALEEQRLMAEATVVQAKQVNIESMGFEDDVVFDEPKSVEDYIPEGTYFSGYLKGGVVVSTALNTADENATPISIRLTGRGDLDEANKLNISECRIEGSAFGDISSERAVIRLEKMICKEGGVYITSDIAGIVYGDDGFNGIKGTVVATSTKHLKNAAIGGLLSGLSSASKGQEGISLGAGGIASSKSKGMGDLLRSGGMNGASNVAEKLADHSLRQAEAMSPVLTIPAGVKVNPKITRGFFVGERGMKNKLKKDRKVSSGQHDKQN